MMKLSFICSFTRLVLLGTRKKFSHWKLWRSVAEQACRKKLEVEELSKTGKPLLCPFWSNFTLQNCNRIACLQRKTHLQIWHICKIVWIFLWHEYIGIVSNTWCRTGVMWNKKHCTTVKVGNKVEQAVPLLNRYTTNTCKLPILNWQYTDSLSTHYRYYRGWLLTNGWLIHPPILDWQSVNTRPTLDQYIAQNCVDISTDMLTDTLPILDRYINQYYGCYLL